MTPQLDDSILTAALEGLELQRQRLEARIAEVRTLMGKAVEPAGRAMTKKRSSQPKAEAEPAPAQKQPKRRRLSAAGRKRIIEATQKRWAEFRAKKAASEKKSAAKKPAKRTPKAPEAPAATE